ncbi:MAG TPA: aldo/keto reductase [Gammaproteobacteria bacterium]|nr:aldo/keto reductase [Gammaproteobacteria bacterium]
MKRRRLGSRGPLVSAIGLGCMGMSEFYGPTDERRAIEVIHRALSLGIDFFDTADMYGPYTNEVLLGKALAGRRHEALVATKFGIVRDEQGGFNGVSGRPDYVKACCEASLRRLRCDHIDLYYQHRVDPNVPIEDTVGTLGELVAAGKVRYIGLSEASVATLRRAHREHPVAALQSEYSLWSREPEDGGHLAACRELGIGFVPYSPLGRGFLSGAIKSLGDLAPDDFRRLTPRFSAENFPRNLAVVAKLEELARGRGRTPAQLALAWVLSRGEDIVPIPGTTKPERLDENAAATEIELTAAELAAIEEVAPKGFALGERYDAKRMTMMNL